MSDPIRVVISGAAGQIGYQFAPLVASGQVFGNDQPVILHLLEITPALGATRGHAMELEDGGYPLLRGIVCTDDLKTAFTDADAVVLIGGFPRKAGMQRADLLAKNGPIFIGQGKAINDFAKSTVKVLVVANPANTNCYVAAQNAPDLPKTAFSAMTRLDQNRATWQLASKANSTVAGVRNVIVWGNHSKTMYPDVDHATIDGKSARDAINDEKWIASEFTPCVQTRGGAIIKARGLSSAQSAARAAALHMRSWFCGTAENEIVSMGVWSDGSYGVEKGIVFSFPCTCKDGKYTIVQGLEMSDAAKAALKVTEAELVEERTETGQ
jgi:malate dehydrogenase